MKKISCIIVTVILLLCVTAGCSKPEGTRKLSDIVSEKVQDIAVVNIISGNTGEIKSYKEADDIDKITAYMQNVRKVHRHLRAAGVTHMKSRERTVHR